MLEDAKQDCEYPPQRKPGALYTSQVLEPADVIRSCILLPFGFLFLFFGAKAVAGEALVREPAI
jgi:hypothetical protein